MRSMACCASSTAETSFAASASAASTAVAKLHRELVKACSPCNMSCWWEVLAQGRAPRLRKMTRGRLSGQHALHDPIAIDEDMRQRRADMDYDQGQQQPLRCLVQSVNRLPGGGIVRSQHRQREQVKGRQA